MVHELVKLYYGKNKTCSEEVEYKKDICMFGIQNRNGEVESLKHAKKQICVLQAELSWHAH